MMELKSIKQMGFTLLELAIALTVISVLLYGVVGSLNKIDDYDEYAENRIFMNKVHDALLTYVQANHFLPCPDSDGDGRENRGTAAPFACVQVEGTLPYLDLGVASTDVWGSSLLYTVNNKADSADINNPDKSASYFSRATIPLAGFDFETPPFGSNNGTGNYKVCNETASSCDGSTPSSAISGFAVIAVVVSYGKNGAETWTGSPDGAAEVENADGNNYFWQGQGSNIAGSSFDDQLIWLTGYEVKYAVITSGAPLPTLP